MGGGSPKPQQPTREEKALLRAQLMTLSKQDDEINERKRRIMRGQYSSFGGLLKRSGRATAGSSAGPGAPGGGKVTIPRLPDDQSRR